MNDEPPNDAGDLLRMRSSPSARWALNLIIFSVANSFFTMIFPGTWLWLEPLRLVAIIAAQYLIIFTPYHQWSYRLLYGGSALLWMMRTTPPRSADPLYQLYLLALLASLQAVLIGAWRHHKYREPPRASEQREGESAQASGRP